MPQRQDEFERVVMPHARHLLRFALRLATDAASAEDLVQETLLLAWRNFHQFRPGTNMRAWLFRILVNEFNGQGRRLRNSPVLIPLHRAPLTGSRQTAESAFGVSEALNLLPAEHRTVLLLGVVEGFTCREIANILSLPIGTIMSRLSRARQNLREKLAPSFCGKGVGP